MRIIRYGLSPIPADPVDADRLKISDRHSVSLEVIHFGCRSTGHFGQKNSKLDERQISEEMIAKLFQVEVLPRRARSDRHHGPDRRLVLRTLSQIRHTPLSLGQETPIPKLNSPPHVATRNHNTKISIL
jgi:hypothetical protein